MKNLENWKKKNSLKGKNIFSDVFSLVYANLSP